MITVKKLASLSHDLRLRKIRRLCAEWRMLIASKGVDALAFYRGYVSDVIGLLPADFADASLKSWIAGISVDASVLERSFFNAELRIEGELGEEAVDWDFSRTQEYENEDRFPAAVYLEDLRSPFNVGSVFRTAAAFGFGRIYLSGDTPSPVHPRAARSSMGAVNTLPWKICTLEEAESDFAEAYGLSSPVSVFGLETGGMDISSFSFPASGIVVIGSEEMGIHPATLSSLGKNRVSIPLPGTKGSLNVGVAFGILARQWASSLLTV